MPSPGHEGASRGSHHETSSLAADHVNALTIGALTLLPAGSRVPLSPVVASSTSPPLPNYRVRVAGHPPPKQPRNCRSCGSTLAAGDLIRIGPDGRATCVWCGANGPTAGTSIGRAGQAASREYERRHQKDSAQAWHRAPADLVLVVLAGLGGYLGVQLLVAIINRAARSATEPPFSSSTARDIGLLFAALAASTVATSLWRRRPQTEAWTTGAKGERAVAARLDRLVPGGVSVVHDRRIPGRRANIDHIVVGPGGIFVIDTKVVNGKPMSRRVGPIWNRGSLRLFVGSRDQTRFVEGMARQVAAVGRALNGVTELSGLPIRAMVVLVGARWPLFSKPLLIEGVWVGSPRELAKEVSKPGAVSTATAARLAEVIANRLPAA